MKILISKLQNGLNEWSEQCDPTDLKLDASIFEQPITVNYSVNRGTGKITVDIIVRTVGMFMCDRCGEDFLYESEGNYMVIFIQRNEPLPDEMPGDDLRSYLFGQRELDVTTEVRDAIMLSMPMKRLCGEDCKGICAGCGANLNVESCRCKAS